MAALVGDNNASGGNADGPIRLPASFPSPVLSSLLPVIEKSRDVRTDLEKIREHAGWLAYEELPLPNFLLPFGLGDDRNRAIDFILVSTCLNFAFTDFETHTKFEVDFAGRRWSDSDALLACLKRALDDGIPILDGGYLSSVTRPALQKIFQGNIEIPLLDERVEILRAVGTVLRDRYAGRFRNFIASGPPRLYADGDGLIERLVREFPRFNDVSAYDGHEVKFYKLAQLGFWLTYSALHRTGGFRLEDAERMTAFADYIVPVALRLMGILRYSAALEEAIDTHQLIARDSTQEIEIRAHTLYATALLTEEINRRRPADKQIIIPQVDARLWSHYHTTFWPHHLTRTIMY